MKNKASIFFKKVICLLSSIAKAKSMAIKNKTSAAKARLIMSSLMKNKKVLLGSISEKIHGLLGHHHHHDDQSKAIVLYNAMATDQPQSSSSCYSTQQYLEYYNDENDHDDKYPDLTHSLFDEEEEDFDFDDDQGGSIIDHLVKNSKEEGEDFSLEEQIDHVADLYIKRFHKQMRLQKLESFKRFQEMLARGV